MKPLAIDNKRLIHFQTTTGPARCPAYSSTVATGWETAEHGVPLQVWHVGGGETADREELGLSAWYLSTAEAPPPPAATCRWSTVIPTRAGRGGHLTPQTG